MVAVSMYVDRSDACGSLMQGDVENPRICIWFAGVRTVAVVVGPGHITGMLSRAPGCMDLLNP